MPTLSNYLELGRCPHCGIDNPSLHNINKAVRTTTQQNKNARFWKVYACQRCGGGVLAASREDGQEVIEVYPKPEIVDDKITSPARDYLQQAIDSKNAPAGSVMLCNSAVDAMLKEYNYKNGSIHERIEKAIEDHVITKEMGKWAHKVRLDSNDPRHADEEYPLPSVDDAERSIKFVKALGEFLFVLPKLIDSEINQFEDTKTD